MRTLARLFVAIGVLGLTQAPLPPLLTTGSALAQQASAPAKKFSRSDLDDGALRLAEQMRQQAGSAAARRSIEDLRREAAAALQRNDPGAALTPLRAIVAANPSDAASWLSYARAQFGASKMDRNDRWTLIENAAIAAYISYQRATTPQAEAAALSFLGSTYSDRSMWRPAINAYKASVDTLDTPATRKIYEELREKYGFRITDYKIDSDSATPRVCVQFSEALPAKVDYTPFVAIAGAANGAIVADEQQLCVEGLQHGQRYSLVVRQGVPSVVGETLLKSADYEVYVKDRAPQVRFTGKNYVLPRVGQEGLPIVSTNTGKIAIDVLRIGDRSLLPTVRSDEFLAQMNSYRIKDFFENKGQKIWTGELEVKPDLNKDVTTAFPVLEAVKKLEPGVYFMVARAGDKPVSKVLNDNDDYVDNIATQWFVVSDLGLTSLTGNDGVQVFVRSLASAAPLAGVEVRLIARNNEVLATGRTDNAGRVGFDPGLARGADGMAPGMIVATNAEGDYAFLDLAQSPFDLSDRGVKGRPPIKGVDAFVYAERGVYRSGETVNLTALLRDGRGLAMAGQALTIVVRRPDGVEYKRALVADQGMGGRAYSTPLLSNAPSGVWRVQAFLDPKSPAIGETTFRVEDYIPERLDLTLTPQQPLVQAGQTTKVDLNARFLYGAPGADLEIKGEIVIQLAKELTLPGLAGYVAGLTDQDFETIRKDIETDIKTGDDGKAVVEVEIPEIETTRPVEARIILRVAEPGGRAVERTITLPVRAAKNMIAIKPAFTELKDGSNAAFNVVALGADGKRMAAKNLRWTLYRVTNSYQWYNNDGRWAYERVKRTRKVAEGRVDVDADNPATISAPVEWGAYRIDLASDDGALASTNYAFTAGWGGEATADTPDLLEVTLDKKAYKAGDSMKMRIVSRFDGQATIAIVGDRINDVVIVNVKTGDNDVTLPVKSEWGAGAYAVTFAHRPLDQQARRMPGRALGLAWFAVDEDRRKLDVSIDTPDRIEPRRSIEIPVKIAGLEPGAEAYVTVAAVDVGILNLTRYQTPDPKAYFFGQRQLSSEIRDLYGLLIDGMQGSRGAIRSGGDAAGGGVEGARPTQEPLARYSGVVKVGADGVARVAFDIPAFNGAMRVMAVAWSQGQVGSAEKDVAVRDKVVVQATTPRFLNVGDRSRFHIQIDNVDGPAGDYTVDLDVRGPVTIAADALRRTVRLEAKGRTSMTVPVSAAGIGVATIQLRLTGPGVDAPQTLALAVQPGTSQLLNRTVRTLPPGESVQISNDLLADFLPGTGSVSVAVSPLAGIDVPALLQSLDRYPYGCSEQIVSRAMPLLYVDRIAPTQALALDGDAHKRVQDAIDRVLARQDNNGAFGLWSAANADDLWLDAFVTDFLTRARENKFTVPQRAFDQALDRLRNTVANTSNVNADNAADIAYAIYVLARNGRPVMGDLRYLADTKMDAFSTPLARAQIAAALALLGDRGRARTAFTSAVDKLESTPPTRLSRADFGSLLRDGAGLLALAAEADADQPLLVRVAATVARERTSTRLTSTQEQSWMVLAAASLAKQSNGMALKIDDAPHAGSYYRTFPGFALDGGGVKISNAGQTPAQVVITTSGHPTAQEPARSQGYDIDRSYYKLDGTPADMTKLKQNDRVVVVLKITEPTAAYARLLLVDQLPAGLEIDNPHLVESGSIDQLPWLKSDVNPVHAEYRDDRFIAAYERSGRDTAVFYAAYVVRAVTPGRYVLPPATIEDMYRPERFGRTGFGVIEVAAP